MVEAAATAGVREDARSTGPGPLALLGRALGVRMARGVEHDAVLRAVREDAGWSNRYAFMTLMSAGIALLGLLLSSPAVVIGAMLVSPLMGPIIGLGFAFATFDWPRVRESLWALAAGSALAVAFCALIVLLSPLQTATSEILARTRPNLFDLLVAIFSALAGAYATVRSRGATIVGVAIATALMPPLAVVGYGMATGQRAIWTGAGALFATNFIAIAASAAAMARLYGFGTRLSPRQTRLQVWLMLGLIAMLAVPLALTLRTIAAEATAEREVNAALVRALGPGAQLTQLSVRHGSQPLKVDAVAVVERFVPNAEAASSAELNKRLARPVELRLAQLPADAGERLAAAERMQSADSARAALDSRVRALRDRLALIAGQSPAAVSIDPVTQIAQVRVAAAPEAGAAAGAAASLTQLRALEARMGRDFPEWTVRLIPPREAPLPQFAFAPGSAEPGPDAAQHAATAAWAVERMDAPGLVAVGMAAPSGDTPAIGEPPLAAARAAAIAALLRAEGVATGEATQQADRAEVAERGLASARVVQLRLATAAEAAAVRASAEAATSDAANAGD